MSKNSKNTALSRIQPKRYTIYGILDFKKKELIHVGLDVAKVIFEFELEGYDEETFDVVSFDVVIN
jgi:hypothetical protein